MTNTKTTKRALLCSTVSLVLCFSMLLGTTFAWFTDSVTSKNNIIQSGNLDVALHYQNADTADWTEVNASTNVFKANALWEPGHVETVKLKVSNLGSLALKYNLAINVASEDGSVNVNGDAFKLSDYIRYGIVEGDHDYATREEALAAVEASATKLNVAYAKSGSIEANGNDQIITVVVFMPTTVTNEANAATGAVVPTINLGINLFATQASVEGDAFGSDYDKNAAWTGDVDVDWYTENANATEFTVSSAEDLAGLAALVNGTAVSSASTPAAGTSQTVQESFKGKTIKLASNVDLNGVAWTPIGTAKNGFCGTFDGCGYTISNLAVTAENNAGLFGYALNGGNVKNLNVKGAVIKAHDYAGAIMGRGYTDIDQCHVEDVTVIVTPYQKADGSYDGGAKAGGIIGQILEGAGNTVTNCSATDVRIYAFRDLGGVVGMVHNNNTVSNNTASKVTLGYILFDQITADENENAGAIYGRVSSSASATPSKDSAENQDYTLVYAVYDVLSLKSLANYVNNGVYTFVGKTVVMIDDIDLCGASWSPIGRIGQSSTDFTYAFRGTFDGGDHTVSNLKVSNTGWAGLFGIAYKATIKNVRVDGVTLESNRMTGAIVGQLYGSIDNCHVSDATITVVPNESGSSFDNGDKVGGIVGWIGDNGNNNALTNCSAIDVSIRAYRDLGGIAGYVAYSTTVDGNAVSDVTLVADQTFNYYGDKDYNANAVWGRNSVSGSGVGVVEGENTVENVTVSCLR